MAEQLDPKKLEEAKKLARELGIEFNEAQRSAKELDITIAGFREELEKINSEISSAFGGFKRITDQLKNTDTITNNIKKGYSGLTSVAQTLQSVQSGYQNISLKEIDNLREKTNLNQSLLKQSLDARKLDEEALISKIAFEKNISTEQVKSAFNAQKALKNNTIQQKELISYLNEQNNLSNQNFSSLIANLQQQEKLNKKLNEQKNLSGAVIADYKAQLTILQNEATILEKQDKLFNDQKSIIESSLKDLKFQEDSLNFQVNLLGKHNDELNKLSALRQEEEERQKETEKYHNTILKKLDEEEIKQKRLNTLLGLGGNAIKGAEMAMDKLGLGGLKTYLNFDKAKESMQQTAEKIESGVQSGNKLTVLSAGLKGLFAGMGKALMDPLSIMVAILNAFKIADAATGDLAKEFNITYKEASGVRNELNDIANISGDINVTTRGLQESMVAVGKSLGTNAMLNKEDLLTFTKLREQAGYTNEELVGIQQLSLVNGKTLENNTKEILGGAQAYAAQNKFAINEKEVLREVSKTSAAIKLTLGGSAEAVAKAVVQAKQFGLNLQQAEQISKSLLQFEDSIGSELEAELLTGKQFNFERARSLALQGKVAEAAAEVAKQVGTAAQFGNMNVIQQEALAKAVGMTRDDLAKSLMDKEALAKLGGQEGTAQQRYNELRAQGLSQAQIAAKLGDKALADQFEQQSAQDRFNATVEKLKEVFVSLVQPLMPVLDIFMAITKPIGIIAGGIGFVLNKLSSILAWALEFKPVLYSLVGVLALTLLPKALSLVGSIGRGLAGAASSIKDMVTGSFKFVGNLILGEGKFTDKLKGALAPKPGEKFAKLREKVKAKQATPGSKLPDTSQVSEGGEKIGKKGATSGFKDNMTNIAEGLKAMGQDGVGKGVFNLTMAGPALLIALPSIPLLLFLGKVSLNQLTNNFGNLAEGLKAMGQDGVGKGALGLVAFGIASIPALLSVPFLLAVSLLGIPAGIGLKALAGGVEAMGKNIGNILKGALGLAAVGAAMIPAAFAFGLLEKVDIGKMIAFSITLPLLGLATAGLGALSGLILAGSLALAALGAALIPAAFAFGLVKDIDTDKMITFSKTVPLLAAATAGLGILSPFILAGSGALIVLGGALIIFGTSMSVLSKYQKSIESTFKLFDIFTPEKVTALFALGPALVSASAGLVAFSLATAGGGLISFLSGDGILNKIEKLASLAQPLNLVSNSLKLMAESLYGVGIALDKIDPKKIEVLSDFASQSAISVAAQGVTTAIAAPIQAISTAVGSISEGTNVTNNETTNAELKEIKNLLKQILNKEGTVYLDSNKVGTTLTTGFSTFKSQ
jgi:hypothetical protein